MINKVISGGQTGADTAGLAAAYDLGIKTGGTAPLFYRIQKFTGEDSTNPELGSKYGLSEDEAYNWAPRTKKNVIDSDGTVWIGYADSDGGRLACATCRDQGKPLIINPSVEELRKWIIQNNIDVLNVAGNRFSAHNPDIYVKLAGGGFPRQTLRENLQFNL